MRVIRLLFIAFLAVTAVSLRAPEPARAASAAAIDADARVTLDQFFKTVINGRDLANKAEAVLIFPSIVKAGFGIGGEFGEGVMHVRGATAAYYNIIGASITVLKNWSSVTRASASISPASMCGYACRAINPSRRGIRRFIRP